MILERENCPMRHKENGNCLPMGGFCTANGDEMCKALHSAYRSGRIDFQRELRGNDTPIADVVEKEKYNKLLRAARRMHEWIFLNSVDEAKAYQECGLTDDDNALLGYIGKMKLEVTEE